MKVKESKSQNPEPQNPKTLGILEPLGPKARNSKALNPKTKVDLLWVLMKKFSVSCHDQQTQCPMYIYLLSL